MSSTTFSMICVIRLNPLKLIDDTYLHLEVVVDSRHRIVRLRTRLALTQAAVPSNSHHQEESGAAPSWRHISKCRRYLVEDQSTFPRRYHDISPSPEQDSARSYPNDGFPTLEHPIALRRQWDVDMRLTCLINRCFHTSTLYFSWE